MSVHISAATLSSLKGAATVPAYRREQLSAGIVHVGCGNFHRAHQAVYLHELFNQGEGHDWAIVGAGVREADDADAPETARAGPLHHSR